MRRRAALQKMGAALLGLAGLARGAAAAVAFDASAQLQRRGALGARFDDPRRDEWQKPHEVIQALALKPDAVVADIGSGTGYFAVRLANMVPKGRVYGVDIEPDMVKYLAERAKREKRGNVTAVAGVPDDPKLPESRSRPHGGRLPPHRRSQRVFPQAARLAEARRAHRHHRLPPGFA